MKKTTKRKSIFLILIGILIISFIQILSQYIGFPDLIKGLFTGVGIGMLVIALMSGNLKSTSN